MKPVTRYLALSKPLKDYLDAEMDKGFNPSIQSELANTKIKGHNIRSGMYIDVYEVTFKLIQSGKTKIGFE